MKKPVLRLETDGIEILRFLDEVRPGHPFEPEDVTDKHLRFRIERGAETVGFLWGHFEPYDTLYFHGVTKGRFWLSKALWKEIVTCCRLFELKTLVCDPIGPNSAAIRNLLGNLGFTPEGTEIRFEIENGQ